MYIIVKVAEIKEIQKQTERSVRDAERATEKALAGAPPFPLFQARET